MVNGNKRKRGLEQGHAMSYNPYLQHDGADQSMVEALTKHNASNVHAAHMGGGQMERRDQADTANAALQFAMHPQSGQESSYLGHDESIDHSEPPVEPNFDLDQGHPGEHEGYALEQAKAILAGRNTAPSGSMTQQQGGGPDRHNSGSPPDDQSPPGQSRAKVGTEEWAASRRLAHKEVERRRRETINDGISELGKIVPGAERNKGSILHRAVVYINELKDRQQQTEQKNNLEKMVFEQAIAEVTGSAEKLKAEVRRLEAEVERWRSAARGAGIENPGR